MGTRSWSVWPEVATIATDRTWPARKAATHVPTATDGSIGRPAWRMPDRVTSTRTGGHPTDAVRRPVRLPAVPSAGEERRPGRPPTVHQVPPERHRQALGVPRAQVVAV